jgi:hypothetical protein
MLLSEADKCLEILLFNILDEFAPPVFILLSIFVSKDFFKHKYYNSQSFIPNKMSSVIFHLYRTQSNEFSFFIEHCVFSFQNDFLNNIHSFLYPIKIAIHLFLSLLECWCETNFFPSFS